MSVGTFDPSALGGPIDPGLLQQLCELAVGFSADELNLSDADVVRFAPLAVHGDWAPTAESLDDDVVAGLVRVFTLGEMQYSSWVAGEKSPVVPLVKALKSRGVYEPTLTRWIKAHSTNKFLPHGSLFDRL
jgi:hypothetical protein